MAVAAAAAAEAGAMIVFGRGGWRSAAGAKAVAAGAGAGSGSSRVSTARDAALDVPVSSVRCCGGAVAVAAGSPKRAARAFRSAASVGPRARGGPAGRRMTEPLRASVGAG